MEVKKFVAVGEDALMEYGQHLGKWRSEVVRMRELNFLSAVLIAN